MKAYKKLHHIASIQGGLFTAKQAESCGYARSNHHYHIKAGNWIKEWAYAGFGITFISAMIAHISVGDPISKVMPPVFAFFLLGVSYLSYKKLVSEG